MFKAITFDITVTKRRRGYHILYREGGPSNFVLDTEGLRDKEVENRCCIEHNHVDYKIVIVPHPIHNMWHFSNTSPPRVTFFA